MFIIPRISETIEIRKDKDKLLFIDNGINQINTFAADQKVHSLIKLIDGKKSNIDLYKELSADYKDLMQTDINHVLNILINKDIAFNEAINTSKTGEDKYQRQIEFFKNLTGFKNGLETQEKIENSHVVVIGVGGLGSWIVYYLAQLGVQEITVIDYDKVELSNLNRQILYSIDDVGKKKVNVIENKLKNINRDITLHKYDIKFMNSSDLENIVDNPVDFIINCTDEPNVFKTGMLTAEFCMMRSIPHIIGGGYNHHLGMIGPTIIPFETPCWGCYELQVKLPEWEELEVIKKRSSIAPSLNLLSSIVACIHSFEIIKVIGKINVPLSSGKKGELDFLDMNIEYENFNRHPDCKFCGKNITTTKRSIDFEKI